MQEQQLEKLSLLVDDQLDNAQAVSMLKSVQRDPELQAKLQRYALISQALKGEQGSVASLDFSDKIKQQLQSEPVYFLPRKKSDDHIKKTSLAVAASVVLAVVGFYAGKMQNQVQPFAEVTAAAEHQMPVEQMNAQFNDYLQAHDNVWYVNNNVGVKSYARLASYQHN
ncbi:MAG: sigma-E factor negative regulatory protein [Methylomonas sp.]|jgi:sigma-E factor negative regulatory protein RseA|uniref:sigma-E factor negative regulatory protein n=1 Tax=Methylomonas sp. TaxID=418 RepID=UPI0025EF8443|nr:sigma-E factor negative regulatory protein [Methylomonas sp.]MCK9605663.1 sigma-E factor negative regulatory protein [Methylomonas sp.]